MLDDVVESAPVVDAGITGHEVAIDGQFDAATARAVAHRLSRTTAAVRGRK